MQVIRESANRFMNPTDELGYGIPNFEDAFNALEILGIEEQVLKHNFALYPNPATTQINFTFPKSIEKATVLLFNVMGSEVLQAEITSADNQVNISKLSNGVYLARIIGDTGVTNTFKIVKQ